MLELRSHIQQDIREAHQHLLGEWHWHAQAQVVYSEDREDSTDTVSVLKVNPQFEPQVSHSEGSEDRDRSTSSVHVVSNADEEVLARKLDGSARVNIGQGPSASTDTADSYRNKRGTSIVGRLHNQTSFISETKSEAPSQPSYLQYLVEKPVFQALFAALIVLNSLTIGLQTDHMAQEVTDSIPTIYAILDKFFCVMFALELSLRIMAYGRNFFAATGMLWGVFDCCVVGMQVLEVLLQTIAPLLSGGQTSTGASNMSFMRVMRILRLVRVLRIIRIIRFMDKLRMLVVSIMNSMRSLFWTLMLLLLGIYVVGIYFTQLVLDFRLDGSSAAILAADKLNPYFGRLSPAMMSLYQAMAGGINWKDLSSPLVEHSTIQGVIFVLYIAFTVLALTNVVTGVFVEGALKSAKQEEEDVMLHTLRNMFCEDGDSEDSDAQFRRLSKEEFKRRLGKPELCEYLQSINVDPREANMLFTLIDDDNSGTIDYEEWVCGCMRIRGAARAIDTILLLHEVVETRRDLDAHRRWVQEHLRPYRPRPPALSCICTAVV